MSERPARVVIIGGGISGLAAAYRLERLSEQHARPIEIFLLESEPRLGGAIRSERHGEFLVEAGPDSFLTVKPWALELARELGLESRIVHTQESFRRTFVARGGKLHPLPDGFVLLAPTALWPLVTSRLFTWRGKLRMACELLLPRGAADEDESLASFVTRRFGREALDRVAQPLAGGIYLAKPEELSLAATMPRFLEMEREHRSVILGMRRQLQPAAASASGARWSLFASFDEGLQVLVDALVRSLSRTRIALGQPVRSLERRGGWQLRLEDGAPLAADAVLVTTPARVAAALLPEGLAELRSDLARIETAPSLTISLAFRAEQVGALPDTFGFVVPRKEGKRLWALTISSRKYPRRAPTGTILLRAFYGGADQQELLSWDEAELTSLAMQEISTWIPLHGDPLVAVVRRYPVGLPCYRVGHLALVRRIRERVEACPGLALAGNSYEGVGIPDCIFSGQQAAEKIWKELASMAGAKQARSAANSG